MAQPNEQTPENLAQDTPVVDVVGGQPSGNAGQAPQTDATEQMDTSSAPAEKPSAEEQKRLVVQAEEETKTMALGQTRYIVSGRWWNNWKEFVKKDEGSKFGSIYQVSVVSTGVPGPIDNSDLLDGAGNLSKTLMENYDFVIVSDKVWDLIFSWYGGGPVLARKVVASWGNNLMVELRPFTLYFIKSSTPKESKAACFSKYELVEVVKAQMCTELGVDPQTTTVWDFYADSKLKQLKDKDTLNDAQIFDGQKILFEEAGSPLTTTTATTSHATYYNSSYDYYNSTRPVRPAEAPGLCGLNNLGLTCFMNSALQCLSNTQPLTDYFLTDAYKADINEVNPLGMKGEFAEEYAKLIKQLWNGNVAEYSPREFKWKLERWANQFAGYQQHDAQELLAFLLDGLHEDLNRIRSKPYIEAKEDEGRPDEVVAQEAWENHKARNNSIIVDWFQGQLKSTLVCPVCDKVSVTFDPFMYLSLPLPRATTRVIPVTVFWNDPTKPLTKYPITIKLEAKISELKEAVAAACGAKVEELLITEVFGSKIIKYYRDQDMVDSILDRDIVYAYERPPAPGMVFTQFINRKLERWNNMYSSMTAFGHPMFIGADPKWTWKQLYNHLLTYLEKFLTSQPKPLAITSPSNEAKEDAEQPQQQQQQDEEEPLFALGILDYYGSKMTPFINDSEPINLDADKPPNIALDWSAEGVALYKSQPEQPEETAKPKEAETTTLEECLNMFTTKEQLGKDDLWYCNRCKELREATKKFDLWKLPPVLVVHLKRFSYTGRRGARDKLDILVDFPLKDLDLSKWILNPSQPCSAYELFAISNHYGNMGGGHYTAYAKNPRTNQWYSFDDSSVTKVSEDKIKTTAAYVLFYRRKDTITTTPSNTTAVTTADGAPAADDSTSNNTSTASTTDDTHATDGGQVTEPMQVVEKEGN